MGLVDGCPPARLCIDPHAPMPVVSEVADLGYCAAKSSIMGFTVTCDHVQRGDHRLRGDLGDNGRWREALWALTEGFQGLLVGDKGTSALGRKRNWPPSVSICKPVAGNMTDPSP